MPDYIARITNRAGLIHSLEVELDIEIAALGKDIRTAGAAGFDSGEIVRAASRALTVEEIRRCLADGRS